MARDVVGVSDGAVLGRSEAYVQFKMNEGRIENERLLAAKRQMKEATAKRLELAASVNEAKRSIDAIKEQLEAKKVERQAATSGSPEEAEIIDEEEYAFIQDLRSAKKRSRGSHEAMLAAADTVAAAASEVDSARQELLTQFNEWYATVHNEEPEPLVPKFDEPPPPTADVMDNDEQFEQLKVPTLGGPKTPAALSSPEPESPDEPPDPPEPPEPKSPQNLQTPQTMRPCAWFVFAVRWPRARVQAKMLCSAMCCAVSCGERCETQPQSDVGRRMRIRGVGTCRQWRYMQNFLMVRFACLSLCKLSFHLCRGESFFAGAGG